MSMIRYDEKFAKTMKKYEQKTVDYDGWKNVVPIYSEWLTFNDGMIKTHGYSKDNHVQFVVEHQLSLDEMKRIVEYYKARLAYLNEVFQ